ncbi:hypothetical protein GCM10018773_16720 [Streptomyces candidus]|nr:hypothetical protein GCM10018773_16720 [Streptomyces candidus]
MREEWQESGPASCAAAFHGSGRYAKDLGGLRHRVSLHVDEDERGPLVGRQSTQCCQQLTVQVLTFGGSLRRLMGFEELFQAFVVVHG